MARSTPRFALGDRVRFTDTVQKARDEHRTVKWESAGIPEKRSYRLNRETDRWEEHVVALAEGIVIGQRALAEYTVYSETEYGEYGVSYGTYTVSQQVPGTSRKAWLVSYDMGRRPVLVLDEHIEAADDKIREALGEILERGNVVYEWPEDEAEAYRSNGGFAEGRDAVRDIRVQKAIDIVRRGA